MLTLSQKILWLIAVVVAITLQGHVAIGYSFEGHFLIANVAWELCSEETQRSIREIMQRSNGFYELLYREDRRCTEVCSPLAEAAKWADDVRDRDEPARVYGYTYAYHYIEIPDTKVDCPVLSDTDVNECKFDYDRDCPGDNCSVGGIVRYTDDLIDGNSTDWLREQKSSSTELVDSWIASNRTLNGDPTRESMMFLVHFLEDLHQPLHSCLASDYCGVWIPVSFFGNAKFDLPESWFWQFLCQIPIVSDWLGRRCGRTMQLHKVWDREIIHKMRDEDYGGSRNAMEQDLLRYIAENPEKKQEWLACPESSNRTCVMQWADEALEIALRYAYKDVDGSYLSNGTNLGDEYWANALPSFWDQMAAAAVRLAFNLELAL